MKTGLVIIDMQHDFVRPGARLCVAGAQQTIPTICAILDSARAKGWPVIHVIREHHASGADVEAYRMELFVKGQGICLPGSKGWEIVEELAPIDGEYVVRKRRFSAFFQTELDMILRRLGVTHLVVTGTQYPNCVRGTAVDGMSLDYEVVVVTDACSAQTDEVAEDNVRDMRNMNICCVPASELEKLLADKACA